MKNKLYSFIPDVDFPHLIRFDEDTGEITSTQQVEPGYYAVKWPDGTPCVLAEMFLLFRCKKVKISKSDGGTVGTNAVHISHIIRYCYKYKKDFWQLTNNNIDNFITILSEEKDITGKHIRNNNTIKSIISTCILFFKWLQENICTDVSLVGVDNGNNRYQIKLIIKTHTENGHKYTYEVYDDNLPPAITDPKKPIPTTIIKKLWDTLSYSKKDAKVSNQIKSWYTKKEQQDHIEYMYKRRELQLFLLESTGLRPQELILISAKKNIIPLENKNILIPTLKRRSNSRDSERLIPIDRSIAMKIQVFIELYRKPLILRLVSKGILIDESHADDSIYLNPLTGKSVKPDACYQEFLRLTKKSGIEQKTCQSMFRHRFITNMVKLQLMSFMDANPLKNRHSIIEADYSTILKKVSAFTGHKNPSSLDHYIDFAWEELGAFSYAYDTKELHDKLQSIFYSLTALNADIICNNPKSNNKALNEISNKIEEIALMTQIKSKNS